MNPCDRLTRLAAAIEPAGWSEHLACVRAGGIEIGHMAASPRIRQDPYALFDAMPLDQMSIVHVSGGVWISAPSARPPAGGHGGACPAG